MSKRSLLFALVVVALFLQSPLFAADTAGTPSDQLMLVMPNGGETIAMGTPAKVVWTGLKSALGYELSVSVDNGKTYQTVAKDLAPEMTTYDWKVKAPVSATALMKVTALINKDGKTMSDVSDKVFAITGDASAASTGGDVIAIPTPTTGGDGVPTKPIVQPTDLRIMSPNGGETLKAGTTTKITWNGTPTAKMYALSLSRDGGKTYKPLAKDLASDATSYSWKVSGPASTKCFVKVTVQSNDALDVIKEDVSDKAFTIAAAVSKTAKPVGTGN